MVLSRRATAYQGQGIHTQLLEIQMLETQLLETNESSSTGSGRCRAGERQQRMAA